MSGTKGIVYICSPYAGETRMHREQNIFNAKRYGVYALKHGYAPIITHLSIAELLDDDVKEDRRLGIQADLALVGVCSEMWVFGERVSGGMKTEMQEAVRRGIKIRWFAETCEEYTNEVTVDRVKRFILPIFNQSTIFDGTTPQY